jgi:hypothetical protein
MPQHVRMDAERHLGGRPKPGQHPAKGNCGHRSAALAHEDIPSGFLFALETAQGAKFDAGQWMDRGHPILKAMDVQAGMDQINLLPAQRAQFGCSQAVPKCHQNHGAVTMPVPIVSGRLHEPFKLALGEVLASAIFGIWQPTKRNCSLYSAWSACARS